MRMNYNIYIFILLLLSSCVADNLEERRNNTILEFYPITSVESKKGALVPTMSRALANETGKDDLNENKIENLTVFFFNSEGEYIWQSSANTNSENNKAELIIPNSIKEKLEGRLKFLVIANAKDRFVGVASPTYDEVKKIILKDEESINKGRLSSLVMTGEQDVTIDWKGQVEKIKLESPVELQRVLSKIRIRIHLSNELDSKDGGKTEKIPEVAFINYAYNSYLLEQKEVDGESLADTDYKSLVANENAEGFCLDMPYYSYYRAWKPSSEDAPFLKVRVPYYSKEGNLSHYLYYNVPLTFQPPEEPIGEDVKDNFFLKRNCIYDVVVNLEVKGGVEEAPVELKSNYVVLDWTTYEVNGDIADWHYLVATPRFGEMLNTRSYTIEYASSVPDVKVKDETLKAAYSYVDKDGKTHNEVYSSKDEDFYPNVEIDKGSQKITITTKKTPINGVPTHISFILTNGKENLDVPIEVIQYPNRYFENEIGEESSLRKELPSNLNNKSLYEIYTIAPGKDEVIGFPKKDENGYTLDNEENANMVSPAFMLASQLGATYPENYSDARKHCQTYWEINTKGVIYEDFRLPTRAELRVIKGMQENTDNKLDWIMTGKYYWSNLSVGPVVMKEDSESTTKAYIRCVRDIKK